ncbi:hypothetical protein IAE37_001312 [Pseudomonas sp. S31]|uniref:hypothetical protein n=1 Tax=Pseudomonas sp. S31 TaxID=1564473 RepID=UPI001912FCB1|nr:hypothetical protein [Pseudomonas sp. S31]MBK4999036.1 hypothetical protein [Pseudomonas sp. S31]
MTLKCCLEKAFPLCVMTLVLLALPKLISAHPLSDKLEAFNNSAPFRPASDDLSPNDALLKYFKGKKFTCRNDVEFSPREDAGAAQALTELVEYTAAGDHEEGFWLDANHRQKREELLDAALKAGSWKAAYLDNVWAIRYPSEDKPAEAASAALIKQAQDGVPIALYKYSTYLFGWDDDSMYRLLNEAIDRGSPQAMALVGGTIVMQASPLWPLGNDMLECAVSHGYANAYHSLGVLADMQGRRLDAYRLWEKGANGGCGECLSRMNEFATMRRRYTPATLKEEMTPELQQIKTFYQKNFLYELSELPETYLRIPERLEFHPTDAELLSLLKRQRILRGEAD